MGITERLARSCSRHPRRTILVWLAVLVLAFGAIATLLGGALTSEGHTTNNPDSEKASKAIGRAFPPDPSRAVSDLVVVRSDRYTVDSPQFGNFVSRLDADGRATGVVANFRTWYATHDRSLVSADRHATLIPIFVPNGSDDIGPVLDVVKRADADPAFNVYVTGDSVFDHDSTKLSEDDLKTGELQFGLPAALIILLLVFGAVVAGLVPIGMAIASILVALGLVSILAHAFELSIYAINMLTGMGLALGIDYSLFVISRYREERGHGRDELDAIAVAGATASRAVLFSGTAFVVAMFGMLIVPSSIMRSLAVGAIAVGVVSVIAALTLMPALLGLLRDRVNSLRIPIVGQSTLEAAKTEGRVWRAIIDRVLRRPVLSLVVASALLLAAASPIFGLHIGSSGVTTLPDRFVSKQGFVALKRDFPQATADPVQVVVAENASSASARSALARLKTRLNGDPRFGRGGGIGRSPDGRVAVLEVPVRGDTHSPAAARAVRDLRSTIIPEVFRDIDVPVYVGGDTAEEVDYYDAVTNPAPIVFAFVLGLTFVLLTIVFRSIAIAAKAILLNLLSVGAAYGLLVLVFQHGVGAGLFGFQKAPTIEAWVPLFLFSVLFGLSMDYQVFLLSRVKEGYDLHGDTREAVAHGVASTARIITGAALIIVAVFAGFARGDMVMFQQMGFGVAVSLILDATLIRSVVLPSMMGLLGRWNWYLPSWLEWLPHIDIERAAPEAPPSPAAG